MVYCCHRPCREKFSNNALRIVQYDRFFSVRIKSYLRLTIEDYRLNDLPAVAYSSDEISEIDLNNIW